MHSCANGGCVVQAQHRKCPPLPPSFFAPHAHPLTRVFHAQPLSFTQPQALGSRISLSRRFLLQGVVFGLCGKLRGQQERLRYYEAHRPAHIGRRVFREIAAAGALGGRATIPQPHSIFRSARSALSGRRNPTRARHAVTEGPFPRVLLHGARPSVHASGQLPPPCGGRQCEDLAQVLLPALPLLRPSAGLWLRASRLHTAAGARFRRLRRLHGRGCAEQVIQARTLRV